MGLSVPAPYVSTADRVSVAEQKNGQLVLSIDAAQSMVHWTLDSSLHTVHGTFRVKRGTLTVDPTSGKATGEIVVDAASGESGNDSRDKKMHNEVLESSHYAEVSFHPDHVEGAIAAQGTSNVKIHGVFSLHGMDHEFTAPAPGGIGRTEVEGFGDFRCPLRRLEIEKPEQFSAEGQARRKCTD